MFEDPILQVFFIGREKKHAERLAMFLLYVMNISNKYVKERYSVDMVETSHYMSKFYQERLDAPPGAGHPGGNFTHSQVSKISYKYSLMKSYTANIHIDEYNITLIQRIAWKEHFISTCVEVAGMEGQLLQDMSDFVDRAMEAYGPFEDDRIS